MDPGHSAGSQTGQSFAALLRSYRTLAGLTQEELAERALMSANAVSALERGERKRPYPDTVRRLAGALNLGESQLADLLRSARQAAPPPPAEPIRLLRLPEPVDEPLTTLIGREQDIVRIGQALCEPRLRALTLTGPGGVGKTRLALAVRQSVSDQFSDGAPVVLLSTVDHPDRIPSAIGAAIGRATGRPPPSGLPEPDHPGHKPHADGNPRRAGVGGAAADHRPEWPDTT
jgi:transcriptional regulator with XRE-family HTH domain